MLGGWSEADLNAYRAALAVGVVAAGLQILFGFFRAGILGEFFPIAAVHGMLAAIGVIIISKQIPVALGVSAKGEPLELLREIPTFISEANPAIALIGAVSIAIMFLWPAVGKKVKFARLVPSPVIVLLVAVPLGMIFDLMHAHSYVLQNHEYQLGEQFLVQMPDRMFGMFREVTTPNFAALGQPVAWKWVLMFFIIGSLESILSAKAVDLLDPWKRKTNLDRDMIAVGSGNFCSALIGGLPMISEIVRSKANIDNGARTRFANMWHGVFLLACVALIPTVLHRIPLAALAGMLVYTGFRLAHPQEFVNVYRIGREQLVIFVVTLVAVLATDLLLGIAIGIAIKFAFHLANGVSLKSLFWPDVETSDVDGQTVRIVAGNSAVFSNWIPLRRNIEQLGLLNGKNIVLDLSRTRLVDHSVMDKLHEMESEFRQRGLQLQLVGLDAHLPLANHALSARRRGLASFRRVTIVIDPELAGTVTGSLLDLGVAEYSVLNGANCCVHVAESRDAVHEPRMRIEIICSREDSDAIIEFLAQDVVPTRRATVCVESISVLGGSMKRRSTSRELEAVH